ncbi:MAG: glucosaminidase domain-containing protein [Bacteroidota bacterium]
MSSTVTPNGTFLAHYINRLLGLVKKYSFELILLTFILYTCISRGMKVGITIHDPEQPATEEAIMSFSAMIPLQLGQLFDNLRSPSQEEQTTTASNVSQYAYADHGHISVERTAAIDIAAPAVTGQDDFNSVALTDDPAPYLSNLTLILSPDYAHRKQLPERIVKAKKQRVQNYLARYARIAQREMKAFGVPASITLAQGLLESNAGDSKLARQSNNHFGIKCRSKCLGCTCRNYGDDTRYDMFRVFDSVAESFREHSELLNTKRYQRLHTYGTNYKKWAHGLKACGYATDKRYAQKLIKIIETLDLDGYDVVL